MSDGKRLWRGLWAAPALACMVLVGCGDDSGDDDIEGDGAVTDGSVSRDGGSDASRPGDASLDATVNIDSGTDSGQPQIDSGAPYYSGKTVTTQQLVVPLSDAGHDRFQGVTYDSEGNFYAVGYRSDGTTATSDNAFVVAKFKADGTPDTTFGNGGVSTVNVVVGGRDIEKGRGVVVLANKQVVIAGDVDHFAAGIDAGVATTDRDIALVRFHVDGGIDTAFGNGGIAIHNPGDAVVYDNVLADGGVVPTLGGADAFWSLALTSDNKLVIHLGSRGDGASGDGGVRVDTDYTLVRLNADGTLDNTFNTAGPTPGVRKLDVGNANAGARTAVVLPDNKIIGTGYTSSTALTNGVAPNSQQPVLYKVNVDGTADTTFATTDRFAAPGVWHDYARPDQKNAEAYTAVQQGSKFVTVGYGPTPGTGTGTDVVLFRFNPEGAQDKGFGVGGAAFIDVAGQADNGRGLAALPDNRLIAVGIGAPAATGSTAPPRDALIAVLGPDGQPDLSFGPGGVKLFNVGGNGDELHNVAVSPDGKKAVAVGVKAAESDTGNQDSLIILLNTGL